MTGSEKFFYENAGYSYDPKTEAEEEGKILYAKSLALAEAYAKDQDWYYEWEADEDGCTGCDCDSEDCKCSSGEPHETLYCLLKDSDGNVLASLSGICEPTREYRRLVEAELADEAMPKEPTVV